MISQEQIAIFANLDSPKSTNYTPEQISKGLEQVASEGFEYFSPRNIGSYFLGNIARIHPDSEYGNRIDLTQRIIASTLHSGVEFAQYFRRVSSENRQQADADEIKYQSRLYKFTKSMKLIPERLRRIIRLRGKKLDSYVSGWYEQESIAKKRVLADVYNTLADTVEKIIKEFEKLNTQEIIELVELNHSFSGEKNGTKQDISFTDPKLRPYGSKFQQQIQRIWYNGTIKDSPNPLSEQYLLPTKKI